MGFVNESKKELLNDFRAKETTTAKKWKIALEILNPETNYVWLSAEITEAWTFINELSWQWKLLKHTEFMDEMQLWEDDFIKQYRP
jgi:hypothetical protein